MSYMVLDMVDFGLHRGSLVSEFLGKLLLNIYHIFSESKEILFAPCCQEEMENGGGPGVSIWLLLDWGKGTAK